MDTALENDMPEADDDTLNLEEITIRISDPQLEGEGFFGKYTSYSLTTHTTLPQYQTQELQVKRRYQEFVWLKNTLQIRYRDIVMPSLPQAKWHGRFDPNFIKSRMSALEDFINWIAQHPVMKNEPVVRLFLEDPEAFSGGAIEGYE